MRKSILITIILVVFVFGISLFGAYLFTKPEEIFFGDKVAVIPLYGTISLSQDSGFFAEDKATPNNFKEQLHKAEKDSSVKAIVIEINSPGGSVVASEEIADAIDETTKPTVAWFSEMALSGGYYVGSSADYIVADQASITGSIGVISIFPEYSRLMDKIGVNFTVVKGGEFKDFSSGFRPMTDEEREMMEDVILEVYEQFLQRVAEKRNFTKAYAREVAQGKIYSGIKATELGLADEVGNKERAIEIASRMGGIEGEPKVVTYRKGRLFGEFISTAFTKIGYGFAKGLMESQYDTHYFS
jgi:protease-4